MRARPKRRPLNETKQWLTAFGEAWKGNRLDDELFTCYLTQCTSRRCTIPTCRCW